MKSDSLVSVVLVQSKPLNLLDGFLRQIQSKLESHYTDYEILVIGQPSSEAFSQKCENVLQKIPSIRFIQLTSWAQPDVAWAAGLENAIGDFVVMFDPLEDPVEAIIETVNLCKSGYDVVVGFATQPLTLGYKVFRSMADNILKMVDYSLPRNATKLRCLSRRAVNSVTSTGRFHHQLSMRIQKIGYPQTAYKYTLLPLKQSETPRSVLVGLRELLHLLVFNSSRPLRWMSGLGLIGSCSAFLFATYSVVIHLMKDNIIEGWTTSIFFISFLFMMQFVILAFFGEYLGRLLDDRSEQADYSVMFEKNSAVMVNQDRVNVLSDAVNS